MRKAWTVLLIGSVVASCATGLDAEQGGHVRAAKRLKVRKGHPVLFVDADLVRRIRAKKDDCRRLGAQVKKGRMKKAAGPDDVKAMRQEVSRFSNGTHPGGYLTTSMWYGIDAYVNRNRLAVAYGREYLQALLDQDVAKARSPECHVLGSVFAMGALYDWLYADLDADLKHRARLGILNVAGLLDTRWGFFRHRGHVGGHATCWANPYALVGLLAIRHDIEREKPDVQTKYFDLLGKVVRNIRKGIEPVHAWICKDGGHHMGWDYGTCYTTMLPYMVWEFATDEKSLIADWQNQHAYWYLYGLRHMARATCRGDSKLLRKTYGEYPTSGDCYGTWFGASGKFNVLVSAFMHDNAHAKWLFNRMNVPSTGEVAYMEMLYKHFAPTAGQPPDKLPLARCFRNAGFTVMRDSWDFDRNTLAVFKSTPFYSRNHHHKDQNSFTVYYKCPLAIDSGGYNMCGEYGSSHWYNYYTRSIAHNTILVYDPAENFGTCRWGKRSNDGGQAYGREPGLVKDLRPGGQCALDGIQRYEHRPDYTYTLGDATKAYSAHKMALFLRHFVYLRRHSGDHPVMVVYDRVVSKKASLKKTYLLHSIAKPTVNGRVFSVEGSDGLDPGNRARLTNEVVLPANASIRAIGGVENNQEFYVADNGDGKPHNYREEFARDFPNVAPVKAIDREQGSFRELGAWRVEVSPGAARLDDRFLNVLSVTDVDGASRPAQVRYVGSDLFEGVAVHDTDGQESTLVLFRRGARPFEQATVRVPDCRKVLLIGLEPGRSYVLVCKQDMLRLTQTAKDAAGAVRVSDQGTVYATLAP